MFDIELPEVFTGDDGQDFRQWVKRFEVALEVVPDAPSCMHVLLPSCLAGSAFTVWESFDQSRQKDFSEVKRVLSAIFGRGSPNTSQVFSNATRLTPSTEYSDVDSAAYIKQDHILATTPPDVEREPQVAATTNICDMLQQVILRLERVEDKLERLQGQQSCQQSQLNPSSPLRQPSTSPNYMEYSPENPTSSPILVCSVNSADLPTSTSRDTQTTSDSFHSEQQPFPPSKFPNDFRMKILLHQKADKEVDKLKQMVKDSSKISPKQIRQYHPRIRRYLWQLPRLVVHEDILYRSKMDRKMTTKIYQAVIPRTLIPDALLLLHSHPSSSHLSIEQTLEKAKSEMFWPFMHQDILNFCKTCTSSNPNQTSCIGHQSPSQNHPTS